MATLRELRFTKRTALICVFSGLGIVCGAYFTLFLRTGYFLSYLIDRSGSVVWMGLLIQIAVFAVLIRWYVRQVRLRIHARKMAAPLPPSISPAKVVLMVVLFQALQAPIGALAVRHIIGSAVPDRVWKKVTMDSLWRDLTFRSSTE
jgi:hypothetical protein